MFNNWLARLFGSRNQRIVRGFRGLVKAIGDLESRVAALSDAELVAQTDVFRERLAKGEIDPGYLATHPMPLSAGVHGYEIFEKKKEGCLRSVLHPAQG